MTEKYGFVYIWFDKKHRRFYIGSHWGTEIDGYLCSSRWMRRSYKRRPEDFKRRIIARVYTNRKDLLLEESRWLQLIPDAELGQRYYNLNNKAYDNAWYADPARRQSMADKIRVSVMKTLEDPEVQSKRKVNSIKRRGSQQRSDTIEKRRESMKAAMAKKFPNRKVRMKGGSEEHRQHMSEKSKGNWDRLSDEQKKITSQKYKDAAIKNNEVRIAKVIGIRWYNNGLINKRVLSPPDDSWIPGKLKETKSRKPFTLEHRQKISDCQKGRVWSEDRKQRHAETIRKSWEHRRIAL